ncbi:ATP-binding protein [Acetomicrobium sp.]|jgi:hypothetical protein|uniref:ATP-binding protein n=1 Tax=Acetomicrobium sp. TaxID=1872099 RepID=UPI0028718932|nr:ATP-binding protein [Acetomicrobium sp.]MDI9376546.1 ATP-binding protein [Synergistota bacterium]MDR9769784.1 ATP-binding protein [Acetomicrobium sp.]HPT65009.1 ATP-binding protein [Acetomicrobium sp.]HQA36850.1 ATP-binding protein [Acetomicrobium sp.]
MRKVPIKLHTANALKWLGSLYRNPAEAIKEHISNAIDEHLKAKDMGEAFSVCEVTYLLEKDRIIIEYPYGMSKEEFEKALQRVADSAKKNMGSKQIGQLGIGMFSFIQIGKKCTFYSKKNDSTETIKVTLRDGSDEAEFETAGKREGLQEPGIKIIISDLLFDPTKSRGPLSPEKLQKVFAEKFDPFLRDGSLKIKIFTKGKFYSVEPLKIELPRIGEAYKNWPLAGDQTKSFSLELYFDPSTCGIVSIRHKGVTIVDDIKILSAYGLEESIYANGDIRGFIDADFLKPLPARTGFEENEDWISLLDELDRLRSSIEAEVENLRQEETKRRLTEIQRNAIELAREILNTEEFKDLELLEGFGRKPPEPKKPPNGFDFVPSSIRLEPWETGTLPLKAFVPKIVPDNSEVELSINDPSVGLKIHKLILKASDADKDGVVTVHVSFTGKSKTTVPAILTATTGKLKPAIAHIRIAEPEGQRVPKSPGIEKEGSRINYEEKPFEEGSLKHSRYISRTIQINTLNSDYKRETMGSDEAKLAYAALMIGKETIAFNDKSGIVDDYLEKMLSFYFKLKYNLARTSPSTVKRPRGRPKKNI